MSGYLNSNQRTASATKSDKLKPVGRLPLYSGVQLGFVKSNTDVQRNGRLSVWVPELGTAPEDEKGWVIASYCSPFAGATNQKTESKTDKEDFDKTQTSYGMWMVPPDINNQVLVMWINGDQGRPIWIGCFYDEFMNNMVPGMAANIKNWQHPGKKIPVAEYNKWDTSITRPDSAMRPYEKTKFKGVGNQGLINDESRGITSASARREAPSTVFGIITPGPPINPDVPQANIRRKGGSSFIMDDGIGSEFVEFATKSGAKIRIDETNGYVYLINRDGTAWIQMDQRGHIDVFSQFDISLRAMRDVNIRGDRNINIEAGQNVFMSAAKDTKLAGQKPIVYDINNIPKSLDVPWYQYVGRGNGDGGNIVFEALYDMHTTVVQNKLYVTTLGTKPRSTDAGQQSYKARRNFNIETDANYNLIANATIFTPPIPTGEIRMKAEHDYSLKVINVPDPDFVYKGQIAMDSIIYGLTVENEIINQSLNDKFYIKCPLIVEKYVEIGDSLYVNKNIYAYDGSYKGIVNAGTLSTPVLIAPDPIPTGAPGENGPFVYVDRPTGVKAPARAPKAELKPLVSAFDILPPIKDPFFSRPSQGWDTIIDRWPTYEPCPLHESFKYITAPGYAPPMTEGTMTYPGSSSPANPTAVSPPTNTDQGANNTEIKPPPLTSDNPVTKDFNFKAFECQLKIHEGVVNKSYRDSLGLPTAGIGHLLRENEIPKYPIGTPVSEQQVSDWFQQDAASSIATAQNFVGMETWSKIDDTRKRAVADLAYNMGPSRLGQFKTFRKNMQEGDYNAAGQSLRDSKWFTQVGNRGPKIIAMVEQGVDPNGCNKKFPPG